MNWEFNSWKEVFLLTIGCGGGFAVAFLTLFFTRADRASDREDKRIADSVATSARHRELDIRSFKLLLDEQKAFYEEKFLAQKEKIEEMQDHINELEKKVAELNAVVNQPKPIIRSIG